MEETKETGLLLVVAAASGTGKSTVCNRLLERHERAALSVSTTTRAPRGEEKDGVHYHFVTREVFEQMIDDGALLEWAEVHGNFYGTGRAAIEAQLAAGKDVLLDIDVQGARAIKDAFGPQAVLVFLLPPSWQVMERRLRDRGTENEQAIARRLDTARAELPAASEFEFLVVNDQVDGAASQIVAILTAARARAALMRPTLDVILGQMADVAAE